MREARYVTIFESGWDMAEFRRPYAITTALSFPIPPRTALCGLIGAILGLPKNDCLRQLADADAVFGLELLAPVRTGNCSINLLDTKNNPTFRPKADNPHTQIRYEFIRLARYRIMFSHSELGPRLADFLEHGQSVYTPCLGLAWMIAWIDGSVRIEKAELVHDGNNRETFPCLVRTDDVVGEINWHNEVRSQRVRVPGETPPEPPATRY